MPRTIEPVTSAWAVLVGPLCTYRPYPVPDATAVTWSSRAETSSSAAGPETWTACPSTARNDASRSVTVPPSMTRTAEPVPAFATRTRSTTLPPPAAIAAPPMVLLDCTSMSDSRPKSPTLSPNVALVRSRGRAAPAVPWTWTSCATERSAAET